MPGHERYRLNTPHVVAETIEGQGGSDAEAIVVNLDSGTYHSLTGDSMLIWNAIIDGVSGDELTAAVAERTGEPASQVAPIIDDFRRSLIEQSLIVEAAATPRRSRRGATCRRPARACSSPRPFQLQRHAGPDPARPRPRGRRARLASRPAGRVSAAPSTPGERGLGADELSLQFGAAAARSDGVVERSYRIGGKELRALLCRRRGSSSERLVALDRAPAGRRGGARCAPGRDLGRGLDGHRAAADAGRGREAAPGRDRHQCRGGLARHLPGGRALAQRRRHRAEPLVVLGRRHRPGAGVGELHPPAPHPPPLARLRERPVRPCGRRRPPRGRIHHRGQERQRQVNDDAVDARQQPPVRGRRLRGGRDGPGGCPLRPQPVRLRQAPRPGHVARFPAARDRGPPRARGRSPGQSRHEYFLRPRHLSPPVHDRVPVAGDRRSAHLGRRGPPS